jgi:hypothetical protein
MSIINVKTLTKLLCNFAFIFILETRFWAVCIVVMQRPGISLMNIK